MDKLKPHLRGVRKKRYTFSNQEIDLDVRAVAAPILNGLGELVTGLSVAGPAYRINKKVSSFAKWLKEVKKVEERLTGGVF